VRSSLIDERAPPWLILFSPSCFLPSPIYCGTPFGTSKFQSSSTLKHLLVFLPFLPIPPWLRAKSTLAVLRWPRRVMTQSPLDNSVSQLVPPRNYRRVYFPPRDLFFLLFGAFLHLNSSITAHVEVSLSISDGVAGIFFLLPSSTLIIFVTRAYRQKGTRRLTPRVRRDKHAFKEDFYVFFPPPTSSYRAGTAVRPASGHSHFIWTRSLTPICGSLLRGICAGHGYPN